MAEEKVRKALALLEQAGRMDLVRPEALGPLRPSADHRWDLRRRSWRVRNRLPPRRFPRDIETEQEVWREEGSEGSSAEQGELVEGSDEQEWWECGKER
ncbi:hypothetical protein NDU88_003740 [Pleurodeles waltl]|uniref:Uncharacterized protein n=1 Tax=Pleurodeles waltl TaxID=8319 RepID=A0AAV7WS55_PLEWA|nr:hypothetical protein NDU88_003740 [Pleurodeles waltl]